jgi:hypothetical protein
MQNKGIEFRRGQHPISCFLACGKAFEGFDELTYDGGFACPEDGVTVDSFKEVF